MGGLFYYVLHTLSHKLSIKQAFLLGVEEKVTKSSNLVGGWRWWGALPCLKPPWWTVMLPPSRFSPPLAQSCSGICAGYSWATALRDWPAFGTSSRCRWWAGCRPPYQRAPQTLLLAPSGPQETGWSEVAWLGEYKRESELEEEGASNALIPSDASGHIGLWLLSHFPEPSGWDWGQWPLLHNLGWRAC